MTKQQNEALARRLGSLCVFRKTLETKPIAALLKVLTAQNALQKAEAYGEFVYSLAEDNYSFSDFLTRTVYTDENRYIIDAARSVQIPEALQANASAELKLFSQLSRLTPADLISADDCGGFAPRFESAAVDFEESFADRLRNIGRYGYGIFASAKMFSVTDSRIVPVESADDISADSFVGYEAERKKVFDNTLALIEGRPAANVLLYGDAGTGKSSTVKACVNHFFDRGLRLIELRKDQLFSLSDIMARISDNPLKFIIFIDDLSFNKNDDCFSMLKAALEGSASAKACNAVIYATSNRRHIVKETFSGRSDADDVHHNDTVQELMSLSDRFGLTVYFEKPDKALYLDIVRTLAEKNGLKIDVKELEVKAEAFALNKGSRSPRAAEQFINSLL